MRDGIGVTTFSLVFVDWRPGPGPNPQARPVFLINRDGQYLCPVTIQVSKAFLAALVKRGGEGDRDRAR